MPKACFAKEVWLELIQTPANNEGRKELYKIVRKFGEAKQGQGLDRCRYLGLAGFGFQAHFTAIVLNLKQIVKQATGVGLKIDGTNQRRNLKERGLRRSGEFFLSIFQRLHSRPFELFRGSKMGVWLLKFRFLQ